MAISRGQALQDARDGLALRAREPGQGFVEQQHAGALGEGHGEFETAALAIGGLGDDPVAEPVFKADIGLAPRGRRRAGRARWAKPPQAVPAGAAARGADQRQGDVVGVRVSRGNSVRTW